MSRNMKYFMVVAGAVLMLCCIGAIATVVVGRVLIGQLGQAVAIDPEQVADIGDKIADYDVPENYAEQMGMDMGGIQMVMIAPADAGNGTMLVMLMQFPAGFSTNEEAMREQMQRSLEQQGQRGSLNLEVVDQEEVTIKGETVTLTIAEGADENGNELRQVTGLFEGKSGPVMLMIVGGIETWDETLVETFIESIR